MTFHIITNMSLLNLSTRLLDRFRCKYARSCSSAAVSLALNSNTTNHITNIDDGIEYNIRKDRMKM